MAKKCTTRRRTKTYNLDELPGAVNVDWRGERDKDVVERVQPSRPTRELTSRHLKYIEAIKSNTITLCIGSPGTGKTSLACGVAVEMLKSRSVYKIVLTRPLVQCDEDLGILPGGVADKTAPYLLPMFEALKEYVPEAELNEMITSGQVEVAPIATMRGRTFHNTFVLADEIENATSRQIRMLLTRVGHNCKMVLNGDTKQSDLRDGCPLVEAIELLECEPRHPQIAVSRLTTADSLRPEIVQFVDDRLSGEFEEPVPSYSPKRS